MKFLNRINANRQLELNFMKYFIALLMSMMIVSGDVWAADVSPVSVNPHVCEQFYGAACQPYPAWLLLSLTSIIVGLFSAMILYGLYGIDKPSENKKRDIFFILIVYALCFIIFHVARHMDPRMMFGYLWGALTVATGLAYLILKLFRLKKENLWIILNVLACSILTFLVTTKAGKLSSDSIYAIGLFWSCALLNVLPYKVFLYVKDIESSLRKPITVLIALSLLVFASVQIYKTKIDYSDYLAGIPKLAEGGNDLAKYRMVQLYADGSNGFERNYEEAYFWMRASYNGCYDLDAYGATEDREFVCDNSDFYYVADRLTPEQKTKVEARVAAWKSMRLSRQ